MYRKCSLRSHFLIFGSFKSLSQENPSASEDFVLQDYKVPFGTGSEHFGSQCICVEMYNVIIKLRPDWRLTKLMRYRGSAGS